MGSIKKKLAKTLRKVTPKEIAPILPIAAMFVPGMQGLTPLMKFAIPQLLTAAGSARQTGDISLMNQALAGIGSLAGIQAGNQALASASTGVGPQGPLTAAQASEAAAQLAKNQGILSNTAAAIGKAPVIGGTFTNLGEGMLNATSLIPGGRPAQVGMNLLGPASLATTMATSDLINKDKPMGTFDDGGMTQAAYDAFLRQGQNLYTDDELNDYFAPLGVAYGGKYTQLANPFPGFTAVQRPMFPGLNYSGLNLVDRIPLKSGGSLRDSGMVQSSSATTGPAGAGGQAETENTNEGGGGLGPQPNDSGDIEMDNTTFDNFNYNMPTIDPNVFKDDEDDGLDINEFNFGPGVMKISPEFDDGFAAPTGLSFGYTVPFNKGGRVGYADGGLALFDRTKQIPNMFTTDELPSDPLSQIVKMGMAVRAPLLDVVEMLGLGVTETAKIVSDLVKKGYDVTEPVRDIAGDAIADTAEFIKEDARDMGRFMTPTYYADRFVVPALRGEEARTDTETRLRKDLSNRGKTSATEERTEMLKQKLFKEKFGNYPVDKVPMSIALGDGMSVNYANGGSIIPRKRPKRMAEISSDIQKRIKEMEEFEQSSKGRADDFVDSLESSGDQVRQDVYDAYVDRYKQMLEGPAGPGMPPMKSFEEMFPFTVGMNTGGAVDLSKSAADPLSDNTPSIEVLQGIKDYIEYLNQMDAAKADMLEKVPNPTGRAEGGLMQLAGSAGDRPTMEDADEHSFRLFNKPYKELTIDELDEFEEEMDRLRSKFMADGGLTQLAMSDPDPMAERFDMMENLALDIFKRPLRSLSDAEIIQLEEVIEDMMPMAHGGSVPQTKSVPAGMQIDGRGGGFIPMGAKEKKDDVPAMLAKNEFVMTADAVKGLGNGSPEKGAQKMYDLMNALEAKV